MLDMGNLSEGVLQGNRIVTSRGTSERGAVIVATELATDSPSVRDGVGESDIFG